MKEEPPLLILQRRPFMPMLPTLGVMVFKPEPGKLLHVCSSIELPWRDNAKEVSCIPEGLYPLRWTRSKRFSDLRKKDVWMWEIQDVADRSGVRIHSGNYAGVDLTHSEGCPLTCMEWKDINNDGVIDGARSGEALEALHAALKPYEKDGLQISVRNATKT